MKLQKKKLYKPTKKEENKAKEVIDMYAPHGIRLQPSTNKEEGIRKAIDDSLKKALKLRLMKKRSKSTVLDGEATIKKAKTRKWGKSPSPDQSPTSPRSKLSTGSNDTIDLL